MQTKAASAASEYIIQPKTSLSHLLSTKCQGVDQATQGYATIDKYAPTKTICDDNLQNSVTSEPKIKNQVYLAVSGASRCRVFYTTN